jgi:hypothetical protein
MCGDYLNTLFLILKKGLKNATLNSVQKYGSYYSCNSNGTSHANLLIMKGHYKFMSQISTAQIPIILNTDKPIQMKQSFISEKCEFWVKNTIINCLHKPVIKLRSSLIITFFSYWNFCCFTWPWLA